MIPEIPEATEPHPHTMKLGEFIAHSASLRSDQSAPWLKNGFSRVHEGVLNDLVQAGAQKGASREISRCDRETEFKALFVALQNLKLMAPSTKSVLSIGEEALAKSIQRLGAVDFFSVVSRKPDDLRFQAGPGRSRHRAARGKGNEAERQCRSSASPTAFRFSSTNPPARSCRRSKSVNWRAYGLAQPKGRSRSVPTSSRSGRFAVHQVQERVEGDHRRLGRARRGNPSRADPGGPAAFEAHSPRSQANELEEKIRHIEQFGPILVEGLCRIRGARNAQKKAEEGLLKLLGRDAATETELTKRTPPSKLIRQRKSEASSRRARGSSQDETAAEACSSNSCKRRRKSGRRSLHTADAKANKDESPESRSPAITASLITIPKLSKELCSRLSRISSERSAPSLRDEVLAR